MDDQYDNVTLATKLGLALPANANLGLVVRFHRRRSALHRTDDFGPFPDPFQSQSRTVELFTRLTASQSYLDGRFSQTIGIGLHPLPNRWADAGLRLIDRWTASASSSIGEETIILAPARCWRWAPSTRSTPSTRARSRRA